MKHYTFLDLKTVNEPYRDAMLEAMTRVVDSGWYIGGPEVETFEKKLAEYCGVPYVVGLTNGLDALRLALRGYVELGSLHKGDKVIVPANTYVATVLAITDNGLEPVFVEASDVTMNMDTTRLEEYWQEGVKAIMPVHLYGRVCWDEALRDFVQHHSLLVIEDNAQAIGAVAGCDGLFGTRKSGGLGHAGCFSFYPTKNIGALGDAGALATHDAELAQAVRAIRNYGSLRQYDNIYKGLNCRLDPMKAAQLSVKLPFADMENGLRAKLAGIYDCYIINPLVRKPMFTDDGACVWHQYVVRVDNRDAFRAYLLEHGVETAVHYATPPYRQTCYSEYADIDMPVSDEIARTCVSLPICRCTSVDDAMEIAEIINSYKD